jgi:hypothetical protein
MIDRMFDICIGFVMALLVFGLALSRSQPMWRVIELEGGKTPATFVVVCASDEKKDVRCRVRDTKR